jgi:hypothetical protein
MTSLDPDEIKRVKLHSVKCSKCRKSVSRLWWFVAKTWEALTDSYILYQIKFQPSVD